MIAHIPLTEFKKSVNNPTHDKWSVAKVVTQAFPSEPGSGWQGDKNANWAKIDGLGWKLLILSKNPSNA